MASFVPRIGLQTGAIRKGVGACPGSSAIASEKSVKKPGAVALVLPNLAALRSSWRWV